MKHAIIAWLVFATAMAAPHAASAPSEDEWYLPVAGTDCKLFVRELGQGPPVVVLHGGFGAEHSYLLDAVGGLTGKYRFIFFDQRGSLRSPCPLDKLTYQGLLDDLEALRNALKVEKMTIFAHSMGTMLAADYAMHYPEHVERLILAGAPPMRAGTKLGPEFEGIVAQSKAAEMMDKRPEVTAERNQLMQQEPEKTPQRETHLWRIDFAGVNMYRADRWRRMKGGMVFYNWEVGDKLSKSRYAQLTGDYDLSGWVKQHPGEVTIINGDHDYADWNNVFYRTLQKEIPFHHVVMKDAGHNMWLDDPDGFRAALDHALKTAWR